MDRSVFSDQLGYGNFEEQTVRTPDFVKKKATKQQLPINPYLWKRRDMRNTLAKRSDGVVVGRVNPSDPLTCFESGARVQSSDSVAKGLATYQSRANAEAIVRNKLLEKVRDDDIDLGVALGEFRETASFLSSSMETMAESLRHASRGRWSLAARALWNLQKEQRRVDIPKRMANTQLAWSYAVKPLLSDIYGAMDAYDRYHNRPFIPVKVVKARDTYRVADAFVYSYSGPTSRYTEEIQHLAEIQISGKLRFEVVNPFLQALDNFGLLNPANVAWELVKLSFVVDWFIPIGDFIKNIVPPQGVAVRDGYIYTKLSGNDHRVVKRVNWSEWPYPPYSISTTQELQVVGKWRAPISTFPSYHLVIPDVSLNQQQVMNGLALMAQAILPRSAEAGRRLRLRV